jgi:hypothetical protein
MNGLQVRVDVGVVTVDDGVDVGDDVMGTRPEPEGPLPLRLHLGQPVGLADREADRGVRGEHRGQRRFVGAALVKPPEVRHGQIADLLHIGYRQRLEAPAADALRRDADLLRAQSRRSPFDVAEGCPVPSYLHPPHAPRVRGGDVVDDERDLRVTLDVAELAR